MTSEMIQLPTGLAGPAWLVSAATSIVLMYNYMLMPFIKYFYADFLKDYWRRKLELQNDSQQNVIGSKHTVDLIDGQYHMLARHLITVCYAVGNKIKTGADLSRDGLIYIELRTNMSDIFNKTISNLHSYQYRDTNKRLDLHLRTLTEVNKTEFYTPIAIALLDEKTDSAAIRNIVLSQIDKMIDQATQLMFEK